MRESQDGFEIAERDMALRGTGDLLGTMQSGHKIFKLSEVAEEPELFLEAYKLVQDAEAITPKQPWESNLFYFCSLLVLNMFYYDSRGELNEEYTTFFKYRKKPNSGHH